MLKTMQMFVIVIVLTCLSYGQALIQIPFTFSDGILGHSQILTVGLDPSATDGLDGTLGETYAPPFPPGGGFDAHFILPVSGDEIDTYKDIRQGDNTSASIGNIVHKVASQLGSGSTALQLSWDLPQGVQLNLKDVIEGFTLFDVDFSSGEGNYTVPFGQTSLLLTMKYVDPPFPVELTSFTGTLLNNSVQLKWETATEVNNYGFEIERKSEVDGWTNIGFVQGHGNSNSPKNYSYEDNNLIGGSKFEYRLKQIDADGKYEYSDVVEIKISPANFNLNQNYPNPFNPTTNIKFTLPVAGIVKIIIYNLLGEEVMKLLDKEYDAGFYSIELNAAGLSSGIYIYRLETTNFIDSKKFVLLK